jgi:hypothetical protein
MNKKILLLSSLFISTLWAAAAPPGTTERVGPMTVTMPSGWTRNVAPDGTIKFQPPRGAPTDVSEVQFSSYESAGAPPDAVHTAIWNQMLRRFEDTKSMQSGQLDRFKWSETEAFDVSERQRLWYRLYTTKDGATHVVTLIVANSAALFRSRVATMDALLGAARFSGPTVSGTTPTSPPPATASNAPDVPIVEAQIHTDISAITSTSNVLTDHILFFGNGIVVRSGFINGPRECYAALAVANLTSLPRNYGRWREDKATRAIDVTWQEGPPWHLTRDGDRLSLAGKRLLKFRAIDSARLEGVYVYRPVGEPPVAFAFNANGRFEAGNLTESMPCRTGTPLIAAGNGTYEIRKWTLILRFDSGATQLMPLAIADAETNLAKVGKFTIGSYEFVREK